MDATVQAFSVIDSHAHGAGALVLLERFPDSGGQPTARHLDSAGARTRPHNLQT